MGDTYYIWIIHSEQEIIIENKTTMHIPYRYISYLPLHVQFFPHVHYLSVSLAGVFIGATCYLCIIHSEQETNSEV